MGSAAGPRSPFLKIAGRNREIVLTNLRGFAKITCVRSRKRCAPNVIWGYSSAGRALEWHSRGQRFDPAYLHQLQLNIVSGGIAQLGARLKRLHTPQQNLINVLSHIWGYSSAGSASNRVCSPATESKVKKLNSSEIQQNQGFLATWGYSSAGRALEWHSRGQRFDPAYLHQKQ